MLFSTPFMWIRTYKNTVNELEELKSQYPEIKISNYEQSVKEANKMFYQRWGYLF